MLSTTTQLLRLSQGQLNLLEACPRKFQHTYLEKLSSPSDPEHEERQTLGSRFHLLMQQREMGLPIDSFLQVDVQLQRWMSSFANAAPEILTPAINDQTFRESEHYRTLQVQDYLLTVVYDLLIADNQQAQILDWKTYPKPLNKSKLAHNWQTRLYTYVLAETSEYLPENISMTYWFVQSEGNPQSIKFNYNAVQHEQTARKLNQLLSKLTNWLQRYQNNEQFPQVVEGSKACNYCQFATRCEREQSTAQESDDNQLSVNGTTLLSNLANIQEVSI
ncbi:PD-(D/E)XK nuclease family protein [aff. Roholtiella sp. LEGE 12411]|uniref:PD-(D/E)XK nuclease family protein n=1 Tax=aff. Roholtiella sp. LEGE 12411 TaxID=1828822 RepID=UPI00187FAE04|nr:PD-(D/E)XK nuclease family protein [aff. Roholtiella sp. LEGE 12411]MBE9034103.1 PD-(D/E)XK nuclease family protein [aff. Roholtiella sp. LEGE 12411]